MRNKIWRFSVLGFLQGVERRMILVVNVLVFLKYFFFA